LVETPSTAEPEGIATFLPGEIRAAVAVRQPDTFAPTMKYTTFDKSGIEGPADEGKLPQA
jgi:hypothetical protein